MNFIFAFFLILGQQPSDEKVISEQLVGAYLTLREFHSGSTLNFDVRGKFSGGGKPGNWPHDSTILVESVRLNSNRLTLSGKRVYLQFDSENRAFKRLISGEEVRLNFERVPGISLSVAVAAATIHGQADLLTVLPAYWRDFLKRLDEGKIKSEKEFDPNILDLSKPPTAPSRQSNEVRPKEKGKLREPKYPENLTRYKLTGRTVVQITIDEMGNAEVNQIIEARGLGFEEAAIEAVQGWHFEPGLKDGKPARFVVKVMINFRIY